MVDGGVLLQPLQTDQELGRGRVQPADVLEQEGHHSFHVLWIIRGTGFLVFFEDILYFLRQLGELPLLRDDEQRHGSRTGGEDEVFETFWFGHSELCCEHGTP